MLGAVKEIIMSNRQKSSGNTERLGFIGAAAGERSAACVGDERSSAAAAGTPSSNTVPDSSIPPLGSFKPLRWGVDSLYLSYQGDIFPEVQSRLKALKLLAQSPEPYQQVEAQYALDAHVFEVKDKGAQRFPYILEDGAFRLQLSNPGKAVPMAYVKISSGCLAADSPVQIEQQLRALLAQLGDITDTAQVSRIDLFVDFSSLDDMEWSREAWVTRAGALSAYAQDGAFTGWAVGQGGPISARLYNKTVEIKKSGKFYLLDLWKEAGWHPGEPVWRLEFQFKREILTQLGLASLYQVMEHLNGLWGYAMTDWLKLTLPNPGDQTRSRWPIHPLWGELSSVDWEGNGGPLLRNFKPTREPNEDRLLAMASSSLISFMARRGIVEMGEGEVAFLRAIYTHLSDKAVWSEVPLGQYLEEKVAAKARQFNTRLNNPDREVEQQAIAQQQQAKAYRKASKG